MDNMSELDQKKQQLRQYFAQIGEIRVFVSGSPAFGHAASTVAILKRFIALGFAKKIQVVYHKGLDPTRPTAQKLEILLPGFNQKTPDASITISSQGMNAVVSFVSLDDELEPKPFAISGGWDEAMPINMFGKSIATPTFEKLKVDWLVVLQPYSWTAQSGAFFKQTPNPSYIGLDGLGKQLPNFVNLGYYRPDPEVSEKDWQLYLELPTLKEEARGRIKFAKAIVDALAKKQDIDLCPVYGIADVASDSKTIVKVPSWTVLFNLISSMHSVQKRAAIVLVLADLKPDNYENLEKAINGSPSTLQLNEHLQKYIAEHLHGKVKVFPNLKTADDLELAIKNLQTDEILVLSIPGLPPDIFDLFYKLATYPSVFEGAGTAGMIVNLNKPYFRLTGPNQQLYPKLPLSVSESADDIAKTANLLQFDLAQWPPNPDDSPAFKLVQFILQCYQSGKIATYFTDVYQFFHNEGNDKLLVGLSYLLNTATFKKLGH